MLNKAQLIGYVGKDPEVRYLADGKAVTTFSVATTESWKDSTGNKKERTDWHSIVIYGKLAEIAGEYLKKGSLVYLEGRLQTRSWEKDGETKYTTEIVAESMKMLPNGKGPQVHEQEAATPAHAEKPSKQAARPSRQAAQRHDDGPF